MLSIGGPLCSAQPQPSWKRMTRPGLWPCMPVLLAHVLRQTADYLLRTGGHCPTRHDSRKREGGFCKKNQSLNVSYALDSYHTLLPMTNRRCIGWSSVDTRAQPV